MKHFTTLAETKLPPEHYPIVQVWLSRGDGVAVYENHALDSSMLGHRKFVSFGSPSAQLETPDPPTRLPDIGNEINWAYQLIGILREPTQ